MTTDEIIKEFLAANPEYDSVEWLPEHQDLTVYFSDSPDPWSPREFIKHSRTWNLLNELENKLIEASGGKN